MQIANENDINEINEKIWERGDICQETAKMSHPRIIPTQSHEWMANHPIYQWNCSENAVHGYVCVRVYVPLVSSPTLEEWRDRCSVSMK